MLALFSLEKVTTMSFMLRSDNNACHTQWGKSMNNSSVVNKHSVFRGDFAKTLINFGPDIPPE